jgi:hypothetical protein
VEAIFRDKMFVMAPVELNRATNDCIDEMSCLEQKCGPTQMRWSVDFDLDWTICEDR